MMKAKFNFKHLRLSLWSFNRINFDFNISNNRIKVYRFTKNILLCPKNFDGPSET